ncbi:response regulator [Paenibacillus elgii]|uniref:response regulator n=1 Tax=Paenibacillus elgii TaxID=189691 RepID=UPI001CB93130|nr:response regulator [Paenibacillus elgii]
MKAILVDDEHLALIGLKKAIEREASEVEIVASYSYSTEVMAGVLAHRPDVVFLDIHMPDINGLNLGKQIQTVVPGTEIVFVTSYDKYAVQAFELYALDYIVKPLQKERLRQTILRIKEKLAIRATKKTQDTNSPMICCFNQIQFKLPGMDTQNVKWRTSKAQELFAYLLHHRDRTINRSVLLELLWPELEEAKAAQHLYTTIYQVRQTLKNSGMDTIRINSGDLEAGYKLDIGEARVDTEEWEYAMRQLGVLDAGTVDAYEHVLNMYKGDYLGKYDYLWAEHERERFRLLWLYHMRKLCEFYEQQKNQKKPFKSISVFNNCFRTRREAISR